MGTVAVLLGKLPGEAGKVAHLESIFLNAILSLTETENEMKNLES